MDYGDRCVNPLFAIRLAVPRDADGLSQTFRHVHRHYTGYVNARMRVTGHLWQGRFSSVALDEHHLHAAMRYVALNPVRARLVARAEDWRWSSVRAHYAGQDDHVRIAPALERVGDFAAFLGADSTKLSPMLRCARRKRSDGLSARRNGLKIWPQGQARCCFRASVDQSRRLPGQRKKRLAQAHCKLQ